jgi:Tfp pilus assembly PilM family ATPase
MPKEAPPIRYSIEINNAFVKIIKTNRAGVIVKAATVKVSGLPEQRDKAYVTALSRFIKKAVRDARITWGIGIPCVLVTGGPHVVIRRFTWPEMDQAALRINAQAEIAPFLPDEAASYSIGYRILRKAAKTETTLAPTLDVMVAAIPTDIASALYGAVSKAGFAPMRLDIIENAQGKLTRVCRVKPEPDEDRISPASYAVLDIGGPQLNMSLFLDGVYYSSRFFSLEASVPEAEEKEPLPEILRDLDIDEEKPAESFDVDGLANEISSVIDYLQYKERNSKLECILLYGDDEKIPNLHGSLSETLEIPVYKADEWLKTGLIKTKKRESVLPYLNTYGAALPAFSGTARQKLGGDMDLRAARKPNPLAQVLIPVACTLAALAVAVFVGIMIPYGMLEDLKRQDERLDAELARYTVTEAQLAALTEEITYITECIAAEAEFHTLYPNMSQVLPVIFGLDDYDLAFGSISVSGGSVSLSGVTDDFYQLADDIVALRDNALFTESVVNSASSSSIAELESLIRNEYDTSFSASLQLTVGAGVK